MKDSLVEEFKRLLAKSSRVLITSHISPDPDAVSSLLLIGTTLKLNFPSKEVRLVLEEKPSRDISFLQDYENIEFSSVLENTKDFYPDLFMLVDGNNFDRSSRHEGDKLRSLLKELSCKTVAIDHHEERDSDSLDLLINNKRPATAQELYELLFEKMLLKKPAGYAKTTLLGIISDTARHKYDNPLHRDTFRIVSNLLDEGASIEELETKTDRFNKNQADVLVNLFSNLTNSTEGYSYSFIDDEFSGKWSAGHKPIDDLKLACEEFINRYLRNFESNLWGFVVYPELVSPGMYSVSFRAAINSKDVSKLAYLLGGGGHKPAAGAKFKADNVQQALNRVKKVISGAVEGD